MAKIKPERAIQKPRSEAEMRTALANLVAGTATMTEPRQDWDDDVVIEDAIAELLQLRGIREDVRNFITKMQTELARK